MIKVILKDTVPGHGKINDIVEVSEGFARNFLFPKNKAIIATPTAINKIEQEKKTIRSKENQIKQKNLSLKERLESLEIVIKKKAKEGKLFGSLTQKEVSESLSQKNLYIDPKKIIIKNHIKTIGNHEVMIALDKGITGILKVTIIDD